MNESYFSFFHLKLSHRIEFSNPLNFCRYQGKPINWFSSSFLFTFRVYANARNFKAFKQFTKHLTNEIRLSVYDSVSKEMRIFRVQMLYKKKLMLFLSVRKLTSTYDELPRFISKIPKNYFPFKQRTEFSTHQRHHSLCLHWICFSLHFFVVVSLNWIGRFC